MILVVRRLKVWKWCKLYAYHMAHHNTSKTKPHSKHLVSLGKFSPKKIMMGVSAIKVVATVFSHARVIIHIDYPQNIKNNPCEYNATYFGTWPRRRFFFIRTMVMVHKWVVTVVKLNELFPHPPFSPDVTRSNYFLFPGLEIRLHL